MSDSQRTEEQRLRPCGNDGRVQFRPSGLGLRLGTANLASSPVARSRDCLNRGVGCHRSNHKLP
jgi:hypothetical protein